MTVVVLKQSMGTYLSVGITAACFAGYVHQAVS